MEVNLWERKIEGFEKLAGLLFPENMTSFPYKYEILISEKILGKCVSTKSGNSVDYRVGNFHD